MRDFRGGNRFAEQESLDLHASFGAQDLELFLGFHVVIMPKLEPSTHDGSNDRHAIVVPAKLVNERAINLRDPTRQPDSAIPRLYASARNRRRFSTDRRIGAFELRIADRFLNQATPWQCQPAHKPMCGAVHAP